MSPLALVTFDNIGLIVKKLNANNLRYTKVACQIIFEDEDNKQAYGAQKNEWGREVASFKTPHSLFIAASVAEIEVILSCLFYIELKVISRTIFILNTQMCHKLNNEEQVKNLHASLALKQFSSHDQFSDKKVAGYAFIDPN